VAEIGKAESALVVPQQSMQVDQTGPYVLVVDKDNKIQVRRIEVGEARGVNAVVRKGLATDERVVTERHPARSPGQVVLPAEAKPEHRYAVGLSSTGPGLRSSSRSSSRWPAWWPLLQIPSRNFPISCRRRLP